MVYLVATGSYVGCLKARRLRALCSRNHEDTKLPRIRNYPGLPHMYACTVPESLDTAATAQVAVGRPTKPPLADMYKGSPFKKCACMLMQFIKPDADATRAHRRACSELEIWPQSIQRLWTIY